MTNSTEHNAQTTLTEFTNPAGETGLRDTVERNAEDIEQLRGILEQTIDQVNRLASATGAPGTESPADAAEVRESTANSPMFQ